MENIADRHHQTQYFLQSSGEVNVENVEQLRQVLRFHEHQYYVLDNPLISDAEYDILFKKLNIFEQQNPLFITATSPTQRVGSNLSNTFSTEAHLVPMLSLENSYNADDLYDWERKIKEMVQQEVVYSVEPKFDGASISLLYENDLLVRAVTRGNGVEGENITQNIRQIRSIPLVAPFSNYGIQQVEIRGEVVMTKKAFQAFNAKLSEQGLAILANPRNAASGSLRLKDTTAVAERGLDAFLYHISHYTLKNNEAKHRYLQSHSGMLQLLWECGFRAPLKEQKNYHSIHEVMAHITNYETLRDELPYEIDGMVIKVDNVTLQDKLGMTSHHPRWAIAYKFKARQATSVLKSVDFQVGRTGSITPVAKITPTHIGGVTVSSISLFNEDIINEKDLRLGDTILIERAGDVIPNIVKSIIELRTGEEQPIIFPTNCPVCASILQKPIGESIWRCENPNCDAQVLERIIHFVGKNAMDIKNLGESNIRKFYQLGLLSSIADIYQLDFKKIATLEGFGQKSIQNISQAIEESKSQPLNRIIFALGIRYVGETTAKTLANKIQNLWQLKDFSTEDLMALEDVGPKVAASITTFFSSNQALQTLQKLEQLGVSFVKPIATAGEGNTPLQGLSFLFTGTLTHMKRSEAEGKVEALGGKIASSVSSKLNYLVIGVAAGSKLEKAKKLNTIHIITEDEFLKMINQ